MLAIYSFQRMWYETSDLKIKMSALNFCFLKFFRSSVDTCSIMLPLLSQHRLLIFWAGKRQPWLRAPCLWPAPTGPRILQNNLRLTNYQGNTILGYVPIRQQSGGDSSGFDIQEHLAVIMYDVTRVSVDGLCSSACLLQELIKKQITSLCDDDFPCLTFSSTCRKQITQWASTPFTCVPPPPTQADHTI